MNNQTNRFENDAALTRAMQQLAASDLTRVPTPPDPRQLWLKAEFSARQKRHLLISNVANVAYAALAAALLSLVYVVSKSGASLAPAVPLPNLSASAALPVIAGILILLLLFVPGRRRAA